MRRNCKLLWALAALLLVAGAYTRPAMGDDVEDVVDEDEDDPYEDVLRAHLIVRKYVEEELIVAGRNVTVYLDIFNAGAATAKDVKITDTLAPGCKLLSGSLETSIATIAVASHAKHSYSMTFATGGSGLMLPPAVVKYTAEDGQAQEGQSSVQSLYIMTPVQQITRYALLAGTYASLGFARSTADWRNLAIVLVVVGAVVGGNWAMKASSTASSSRKRRAALKELEKEQ